MSRQTFVFMLLGLLFAATLIVTPLIGWPGAEFERVAWTLRVPRVCMGVLAGAGLALAGVMFQAIFRNPLASPFTLGVSSGASLAAAYCLLNGISGLWFGVSKLSLAAFAGAIVCVLIVYGITRLKQGFSTGTLLLAGVTIGFVCSALIVLAMYRADRHDIQAIIKWLMGSCEVVSFAPALDAFVFVLIGTAIAIHAHRDLDLLMMGELVAASRGVDVRRARRRIYFAASLITAGVVAQCGPIGFVGLVIPHIMRLLVGPTHRTLLPASLLGGAVFLPICDAMARTGVLLSGSSRQLPVGVLTNLIGGGFFLYLLLRRKEERPIL
ncbi:MAG: iron ABC transporter permease [Phycisphaerae bacterium]|nr:iron ABC transporter permease [Phycisphaerae bacterium]